MSTLANIPHQIASYLLKIEAVSLRPHQPFTWTSGIKSPIYCDNRLTMSFPEIRDYIAESFALSSGSNIRRLRPLLEQPQPGFRMRPLFHRR